MRTIWRRAHPVRLPERVDTAPHLELFEAYQRDRYHADFEKMLVEELERELQEMRT